MTAPATSELHHALEQAFGERLVVLRRSNSRYATSYPLQEIEIELSSGPRLELMFKDLGAPSAAARGVKPSFLTDPLREIDVYTKLLPPARLSTAKCWGASVDPTRGRYWLFLERVPGVELYQVGERATWEHVARWLAGMHAALAGGSSGRHRLLRYDRELLTRWARRATEHAVDDRRDRLAAIAERYEQVVGRMLASPATPIHGEFYASNVLVDDPATPSRVCPIDWEMAALGPALVDLAALTSGSWSEPDRDAIAQAYREALPAADRLPEADFRQALRACRLHLAFQWLGWSPGWSAPSEHAADWLGSALELSAALDL